MENIFELITGDFIYLSCIDGLIYYQPTHTEGELEKSEASEYKLVSKEDTKHRVLIEREDLQGINAYFETEETAKNYIKSLAGFINKLKSSNNS